MSIAEDRAIENLVSQYNDSLQLKSYIRSLMSPFNGMLEQMQRARMERSIEFASGIALDIIGDVVGAKRVVLGGASADWWGYYENALALGNGSLDDPSVGGKFYDLGLPISKDLYLEDGDYRKWIYARILLNSRNRGVEDVIQYIKLLFMEEKQLPFTITEQHTPLNLAIRVNGVLKPKLRVIFAKRLPLVRPAGVGMTLVDNSGNIKLEY